MKFELTISGLLVIALKSGKKEDKPEHPTAIDIIVPDADHHTCRLSYLPGEVQHAEEKPKQLAEMVIDEVGRRVASLKLQKRVLQFTLDQNPTKQHTVFWGTFPAQPAKKSDKPGLNWIPKLGDLGFPGFKVGPAGKLPGGARARIMLPPGTLESRNPIVDQFTKEPVVWTFPGGKNVKRILANEVVFTATGVKLAISENGNELLTSTLGQTDTLRMCISHETTEVPLDYSSPNQILAHLKHFDVLTGATAKFQEPTVDEVPRTGRPSCMGVVLVHNGS